MSNLSIIIIAFLAGAAGAFLTIQLAPSVPDQETAPMLKILSTAEQDALNLPFAEGIQVGNIIYLSGQIGALPGTMALVPGGVQAETRQTLENVKASLDRYGSSMERVIKCTVFMADMADWPAMNEVYVEMFAGHRPARSAFGAAGVALDGAVEIECIALAGQAGS